MKEYWKDIISYEGLYQISNLGRVKSLGTMIWNSRGYYHRKGLIFKPTYDKDGYVHVGLSKNGTYRTFYVHRLVAIAFIPNPYNLPEINHIDECKTNNTVENLEWCRRKYNVNYGIGHRRSTETQSREVLQIDLDGNIIKKWKSIRDAGRNGFNRSLISACCLKKAKTHRGYRWRYYSHEDLL